MNNKAIKNLSNHAFKTCQLVAMQHDVELTNVFSINSRHVAYLRNQSKVNPTLSKFSPISRS